MSEDKYLELIDLHKQSGNVEGQVKAMEGLKTFRSQAAPVEAPAEQAPTPISPFPERRGETRAAQELPELGSGGLLSGEGKAKALAITPALLVTTDERELADIITSNYPEIGMQETPAGEIVLANNKTGARVMVNQPGLSKLDILQGLGIGSTFLYAGAGAGLGTQGVKLGAKVLARRMAQGAAGSAATQTLAEAGQAAAGGQVDPGEIGIAATFGAGAELVMPIFSGAKGAISSVIGKGKEGVSSLMRSVEKMSDEGAATMLSNAMVREGMTPEQLVSKLQDLGPEALPADLGKSFSRLLKESINKFPQVQGKADVILDKRQAGQAKRLTGAFEDASGTSMLSASDEIIRLENSMGPEITKLYAAAKAEPFNPSSRLQKVIFGDNDLSKAMKAAQSRLKNRRALGEEITNLDVIDATKQQLDDQIGSALRKGEKNNARDLIRLKNFMVEEVDKAVPVYKQARNMFAGKAQLKQAAETGDLFFKMKPDEIADFIKTSSESELKMYRLGAKQALIDKIDSMQITHDAVKRLFGKGGDVKKLRSLFADERAFNNFSRVMEREANFVMTRRTAQGGSSTAQQMFDMNTSSAALTKARTIMGDPIAAADWMQSVSVGLGKKKGSEAQVRSLEKAADFLLESGMDASKIIGVLKRGSPKEVERIVKNKLRTGVAPAAITTTGVIQAEQRND